MRVLGVGIDLVDVARVERLLERKGERALRRLLTEAERAYVTARPNPAGHLAARLAAKEAVYKALQVIPGSRGIGWRDIEVQRDPAGRPSVRFAGLAARLAAERGGITVTLSLTHSAVTAGAVAVLESVDNL